MKKYFSILLFFFSFSAAAQTSEPRIVINLNKGWQFAKGGNAPWKNVNLPHTWNVQDVMDDEPGYYRGAGWYKKRLVMDKQLQGKEISLYFEGANQVTEVFINGKQAGLHAGGYTGFSVRATTFLRQGNNELLVKVDNSHNENIPPLSADFTFYGGIYRDVYLVAVDKIHFTTNDHGSNGVYITTPQVSAATASVHIKSIVSNQTNHAAKIFVTTTILDANKTTVARTKTNVTLAAGAGKEVLQNIASVKNPRLWSPEKPYLYTVETSITDSKGKLLDKISNPLGFRWFSFDANRGFFLNGAPYKLVGASRHQDYKDLGNAVPDSLAVQDMVLLKNMGGNFLRVAHYPQDPAVMRACDSIGLLASVEIPIVNEITDNEAFYRNCEQMQLEMIKQGFNHPSVVLWCYMNEVLLRPRFGNDKPRQEKYFANITALAKRLEALTRKEDPYRYTMMANHGNFNHYQSLRLLEIPMVVGWNLYSGWYGSKMEDFPVFLDEFHKKYPQTPFMVTEYGADADPRIRSTQPVRFDKSVEYTTRFHQYYLTAMMNRPYVAGAMIWNLADFNSETRTETMPHINNKGLLEWDRKPKDPYFYYQAMLLKQPFLKILGSCQMKFGIADSSSGLCYRPVQIAANLDSITIFLNGIRQANVPVADGLAEWRLPFKEGSNTLVVEGKKNNEVYRDSISTIVHLQPHCLTDEKFPFEQINIMLGTTRFFVDGKGEWWQPDQAYTRGGWGSVGGKTFRIENNGRLPYGTDKNIIGTENDPVYQTQQTGIQQYRLDVPPGKYEVLLHFAELLGGKVKIPPYNLSDDERDDKIKRRIFNVKVNGRPLLERFNIAEEFGLAKAVVKSTTVVVNSSESVIINFEPVEGEPVLNALQLRRIAAEAGK